MKTDVLKNIKATEDEYRSMISTAMADKKRSIADAELEADNLIMKATSTAEDYKKKRLADARQQAEKKHAEIVGDGERRAAELKEAGSKKLDKAVELLVTRFKEQLHVHA
jgi:V/A-type H+-transporting ATPase subunit G/H